MRYGLLTLILASLLGLSPALMAKANPEEEIEFLLQSVSDSGCTFVREGTRYESTVAAEHLRTKYLEDKRHINTAEQFIDRLASPGSLDSQPYVVTCGGQTMTSREWLNEALVTYHLNK